jgi:transcriptional regulator with XRE-family HTH domain
MPDKGAVVKIAASGFQVSDRFLDDGRMSDWQRLGRYVLARREELGYKQRGDIASAVGVSTRVMSDIENGRRGNFDPVTVAALERTLGWETGSAARIAAGGEPAFRGGVVSPPTETGVSVGGQTDEITMIYESNMSARQKLEAIRMVLELRKQAEADSAASGDSTEDQAPLHNKV